MITTRYKAAPISKAQLENLALRIRESTGYQDKEAFPVVRFLEIGLPMMYPEVQLEILPKEEMLREEGRTYPMQNKICIREDVYHKAWEGDGRARFTIVHETGHFIVNTPDSISLCRLAEGETLKPYEDPEWQANTFASYLLMPRDMIRGMTKEEVAEHFQVSKEAARVALRSTK